ncbi:hypothetical protein TNCV_345961 [Trichonephila clavipes]|nr:hypothetical protein TNCV_345961 [Trichonephila clavipes]
MYRSKDDDQWKTFLPSLGPSPKEKPYQSQKMKYLNIFYSNSAIPSRPVPFDWVSPWQHFSKLQATPAMVGWLNINVALFSCTRAFGDGPRNFEPWSSDEDDT